MDESEETFEGDFFPMDDCVVTDRRGEETRPFAGQGVWLTPYVSSTILEAAGALSTSDAATQAQGFADLRWAVAESVLRHNLTNPNTGEPMPQFWGDPDAVRLPAQALVHLFRLIVSGEAPSARPKGSSRGPSGTTTPKSSAPRIVSSKGVPPRRRSG